MSTTPPRQLLDLAPKVGRRPSATLSIRVMRQLTHDDLGLLATSKALRVKPRPIGEIKHSHHSLARALASGMDDTQAGIETGFSSTTIWRLKQDPMFQDLVEHYRNHVEEAFADAHKRLAEVGMTALDELQDRLVNEPQEFSLKALMDTVALTFDRSVAPAKGPPRSTGPGQTVGPVQFVVQFPEVRDKTSPIIEAKVLEPEQ